MTLRLSALGGSREATNPAANYLANARRLAVLEPWLVLLLAGYRLRR